MMRNGQRLLRLINQLLDLSKLEAGKMTLQATSNSTWFNSLERLHHPMNPLAADKKIKYFFYPEVQNSCVISIMEKIEKVIHNLFSNAFKFTKEDGEVILYLKAGWKTLQHH